MKNNVIDFTPMYETRMLITHIVNGKPEQDRYYNKFKFYINIFKTILYTKSSYIITTPKYVYTHIVKEGKKTILLEPTIYLNDD